jgi:nucleoside-diphosphate-sugar epimerase
MPVPPVLILGATGRIGRVLRQCWPRLWPGLETSGAALWQTRGALTGPGWVRLDPLVDATALARAAAGRAAILCLAGVTNARAAHGADMADNITLAEAAVRAAATTSARVLLTSSAAVYGARPGRLEEDGPLAPLSEYGQAKIDMETRAARLGRELGVEVCALRIGNIAGLDAILGGWHPGFVLDRFADGRTPRRSYIGPLTLARVLGALLAAKTLPPVLNVAAPGMVAMGDLLDAAGLGWTPRPAPDTAIAEVHLSVSRLGRLVALDETDGQPRTLVSEWRETIQDRDGADLT